MNTYHVCFLNNGKIVCTSRQEADSAESAMLRAEFAMQCFYPNIAYDKVDATIERPLWVGFVPTALSSRLGDSK